MHSTQGTLAILPDMNKLLGSHLAQSLTALATLVALFLTLFLVPGVQRWADSNGFLILLVASVLLLLAVLLVGTLQQQAQSTIGDLRIMLRDRDDQIRQLKSRLDELERAPEDHDRSVFKEFFELLPAERGDIKFLQEFWHPKRHHRDDFGDLRDFHHNWSKNPNREFLNGDVEAKRQKFAAALDAFFGKKASNMFVSPADPEFFEIPPEWEATDPDRYRSVREEISRLADVVIESYIELVRTARQAGM